MSLCFLHIGTLADSGGVCNIAQFLMLWIQLEVFLIQAKVTVLFLALHRVSTCRGTKMTQLTIVCQIHVCWTCWTFLTWGIIVVDHLCLQCGIYDICSWHGTSREKTHFSSMGDSVMALIMKGILPDQAGKETSNTSEAMLMFHWMLAPILTVLTS